MPEPLTRRVELLGRRFEAPPLIVTLWQPYAELIAAGVKPVEFRTWKYPKRYEGKRIAIHAAKRPLDDDWLRQIDECRERFTPKDAAPLAPVQAHAWRSACEEHRGCVVAVATLAGIERDGWGYGWKLRDVRRTRAVLFRGRQGITRFDRWIETFGYTVSSMGTFASGEPLANDVARAVDLDWQYIDHPLSLHLLAMRGTKGAARG